MRELTNYVTFAFVPTAFVYIENLYKGDNITRLTLEPHSVPSVNFDSLVKHHFRIFVRRKLICYSHINWNKKIAKTNFSQENGHEIYPVISELLHNILLPRYYNEWNRLIARKNIVSERTWFYLSNSEMLPAWNTSKGVAGTFETVYQILKMHMFACNKSGVILSESDAIPVYTALKAKIKQAYYGKDIINEFSTGYKYHGYFPTQTLLKSRYYFQAGILEWWQKYFRRCLRMITEFGMKEITSRRSKYNDSNTWPENHSNHSSVYALGIIPLVGFLLSILPFTLIDSNFCANALLFVKLSFSFCIKSCRNYQLSSRNMCYCFQYKVILVIKKE